MFKTIYTKLAGAQALVFFALGVAFILATERMLEGRRLVELAADLVIGAVLFALLAGLLVFNLLTRRLRALAIAVDRFRDSLPALSSDCHHHHQHPGLEGLTGQPGGGAAF